MIQNLYQEEESVWSVWGRSDTVGPALTQNEHTHEVPRDDFYSPESFVSTRLLDSKRGVPQNTNPGCVINRHW